MIPRRRSAGHALIVWSGAVLAGAALAPLPAHADGALEQRYGAAVRDAIQRVWIAPHGLPANAGCRLAIKQLPGGEVVAVEVMPDCAFDAEARQSLVRAVQRAAPLPYIGFEPVFSRSLTITFTSAAQ